MTDNKICWPKMETTKKVLTTRFGAFSHSTADTFSALQKITISGAAQITQHHQQQQQQQQQQHQHHQHRFIFVFILFFSFHHLLFIHSFSIEGQ